MTCGSSSTAGRPGTRSNTGCAHDGPEIWKAMTKAPRVALVAAPANRAAYLTRAYADMVADSQRLSEVISCLRAQHSQEQIAEWQAMASSSAFVDLAESLMTRHYDPRYAKHRARIEVPLAEVDAGPLTEQTLPAAAARVAAAVNSLV